MENWSEKQNEMLGKIFGEIKKQTNPVWKSDALALLRLDDENFIMAYLDTTEITGEAEDIDLCNQRAIHLKINN